MPEEKKLNADQLEAIKHGEGPLLIIAGAGTGKTTVVTERINYLITEKQISPSEILALTFTEKAAREMQERVDIALPLGYANMWISTFHAFGDRILRNEAVNVGLDPRYRLMTQAESIQFLRKNLFKFELNYFRPLGNPNKFVEGMLQHFSRLKDEDIQPNQYIDWVKDQRSKIKDQNEDEDLNKYQELAMAFKTYEDLKVKESLMDFGDLIGHVLEIFRRRPNILKNYQKKFKFILVDEFQDTNFSQYALIKLLAPPQENNLTVVADDNQSIYKFRGAAISNILGFKNDYPKAKCVVLNNNYRSTQTILDASYKLIKNNDPDTLEASLGISKKLKKTRAVEEKPVELILADRVENEAEAVADKIKLLMDNSLQTIAEDKNTVNGSRKAASYSYKDFAILVRANNHADPFIRAFGRAGIPYQFLGPGMLFKQPEVKDLIAYLSVLYDFEDSVAMYRVLSMDIFNISGKDLAAIVNFSRKQNLSLFEACEKGTTDETLIISKEAKITLDMVAKMISRHLELVKKETAGQILYYFLEDCGLLKELTICQNASEEKRVQNITKFFDKLKSYETDHEDASVFGVVDFINLSMELGESPLASDFDWFDNDAVNILTVHSAKGLEFPIVFLVNLVSQRFPTSERHEQIPIPEELIKEILPQGDFHLEEERRLFYVGMTRAKDRLFLTAANYYGEGKREKKISQFIEEALGQDAIRLMQNIIPENQLPIFNFKPQVETPVNNETIKQSIGYLSYSQIDTFNTCPLQYKFRYILRIPTPPAAAASFGATIHETMKDFYQQVVAGQKPDKEDLLAVFSENWSPLGYSSKALEEKYKREGIKILSEFFKKSYDPENIPTALEQIFSVKISPTLRVGGKIDRIDITKNGVEIIDYKTGKSTTKKDIEKDLQLTLYAMSATDGTLTYMGIFKKTPKPEEVAVSFYFFDNQEKISSFRKQEDFIKVKEELVKKAEEISKSSFSPTPGKLCDFCEFKLICEAWS